MRGSSEARGDAAAPPALGFALPSVSEANRPAYRAAAAVGAALAGASSLRRRPGRVEKDMAEKEALRLERCANGR